MNVGVVHRYCALCNSRHQWKQAENKQQRNNKKRNFIQIIAMHKVDKEHEKCKA